MYEYEGSALQIRGNGAIAYRDPECNVSFESCQDIRLIRGRVTRKRALFRTVSTDCVHCWFTFWIFSICYHGTVDLNLDLPCTRVCTKFSISIKGWSIDAGPVSRIRPVQNEVTKFSTKFSSARGSPLQNRVLYRKSLMYIFYVVNP